MYSDARKVLQAKSSSSDGSQTKRGARSFRKVVSAVHQSVVKKAGKTDVMKMFSGAMTMVKKKREVTTPLTGSVQSLLKNWAWEAFHEELAEIAASAAQAQ